MRAYKNCAYIFTWAWYVQVYSHGSIRAARNNPLVILTSYYIYKPSPNPRRHQSIFWVVAGLIMFTSPPVQRTQQLHNQEDNEERISCNRNSPRQVMIDTLAGINTVSPVHDSLPRFCPISQPIFLPQISNTRLTSTPRTLAQSTKLCQRWINWNC